MDYIKEAFIKVKQDISILQEEIYFVKKDMNELRALIEDLISISRQVLIEKEEEKELNSKERIQTQPLEKSTDNIFIPTGKEAFNLLKHQNKHISIGNEGVPTDKQTDQQTNRQTDFSSFVLDKLTNRQVIQGEPIYSAKKDSFKEAVGMLESLDNLKKELRLKFKRLTDQEVLVFSSLYQIEEEQGYADYKAISNKLGLTESSIRDYVGKLIKKGIPIDKIKIKNKSIQLRISPDLKKIANLSTILLLRDM